MPPPRCGPPLASNNTPRNPALDPPAPSTAVTLRLLSNFYIDVKPLCALLPGEVGVVRDGDSERFRQLIVDQVQQRLFSAHAKFFQREKAAGRIVFATPKNVLALGYRLQTNNLARGRQPTRSGLGASYTNVFPNTVVSSLVTSLDWDTLASRIGPDALIDLLSSPSIALFVPLPNACFLQVSGVPVADLKPRDLATASAGQHVSSRTCHVRRKRKRRRRGKTPTRDEDKEDEQDEREASPMDVDIVPPSAPVSPFRPLPPRIEVSASPSPTKRTRPLGPALSAPLLGISPFTSTQQASQALPTQPLSTLLSSTKRLRPTQSSGSVFGVSSEGERASKRRRVETLHPANSIVFSRHRMYHNRVAKAKGGKLPYGLPTKHILTRLPSIFPPVPPSGARPLKAVAEAPARHLAKYIFPRQFGLHNVFTSEKARTSFEVMPDYLDREVEIKKLGSLKTPQRLKTMSHKRLSQEERSAVLELAEQPRTQVSRGDVSIDISHASLVVPHGQTQAQEKAREKPKLAEYACSFYEVERFVLDAVAEVIPRAFWGSDANCRVVQSRISAFIRMRRFETTSLHALMQGFSLLSCEWLSASAQKPTAEDMEKRKELLSEFLFWLFDGFVIDLIRTTFYVTDAATHQNRPLYFRQDDWSALCAPLLAQLGSSVFEQVPSSQLIPLQRTRELGFSYVRLLPKESGVRPIVNLARRPIKLGLNGQKEVGQPINKILQGVFDKRKPHLVGSLVADPQQIFAKLRAFKRRMLDKHGGEMPKLYFVKVDVRAAYDTIQQDKLLEIVEGVLTETLYWIQKYAQVSPLAGRATKAFKRAACTDGEYGAFTDLAQKLAQELHNVVLSDQVVYQNVERDRLMQLLREHITTNLVKVSGRLYRQQTGIPQGSVLSSLLCSLFYADMERKKLGFTDNENSTLLRYVDDFLFVSTEQERAGRFLRVMDDGIPEYGCSISAEKRLTNFDISLKDGEVVPPLKEGDDIHDQLTIQRYRKPGQAFLNAMFRAVKIRSHVLYTDTTHNSLATVYSNIYRAMLVVALKFQAYVQEWGVDPRRKIGFLYKVIRQVVNFQWAAAVNQSRSRKARTLGVEFALKRPWVIWLSYHAFHRVFAHRPAAYAPLRDLLSKEVRSPGLKGASVHLRKVVASEGNGFADRVNGEKRARKG
ncbi:Telomerase reverse transcriptase [Rhodotorula kratochvilovae]